MDFNSIRTSINIKNNSKIKKFISKGKLYHTNKDNKFILQANKTSNNIVKKSNFFIIEHYFNLIKKLEIFNKKLNTEKKRNLTLILVIDNILEEIKKIDLNIKIKYQETNEVIKILSQNFLTFLNYFEEIYNFKINLDNEKLFYKKNSLESFKNKLESKYILESNKLNYIINIYDKELNSIVRKKKENEVFKKKYLTDNKNNASIIKELKHKLEFKCHMIDKLNFERTNMNNEIENLNKKINDLKELNIEYSKTNNIMKKLNEKLIKDKDEIIREKNLYKNIIVKLEKQLTNIDKSKFKIHDELKKLEKNRNNYLLKKIQFENLSNSKTKLEKEGLFIIEELNRIRQSVLFKSIVREENKEKINNKIILKKVDFLKIIENKYFKKINEVEKKEKEDENFIINNLSKLRCLLDNIYKDYIMNFNKNLGVTNFNEFMYQFLLNYNIDFKKRKMRNTFSFEDIDELVISFYYFIFNEKYNYLWEVSTVRLFIKNKYTTDEIFFYLSIKNLIFKGCHYNDINYSFNIILYIPFDYIETIINKYLKSWVETSGFLNNLKKYINNKNWIDGYFVCRLLLEIYCENRRSLLLKWKKNYDFYIKNSEEINDEMTFLKFCSFIKYTFDFSSDIIIYNLFQNSFIFGNQQITFYSFLLALDNSNLLCLSIFDKTRVLKNYSLIITDEVNNFFKKEIEWKNIKYLSTKFQETTNQKFKYYIKFLNSILRKDKIIDIDKFRYFNDSETFFFNFIEDIFSLFKINKWLEIKNFENFNLNEFSKIKKNLVLDIFNFIFKESNLLNQEIKKTNKKLRSITKIQKIFKEKIFKRILKNNLK